MREDWWCPSLKQVIRSTQRAPTVQSIAAAYIKDRFQGQQYLAIHLRLADRCCGKTDDSGDTFAACYHKIPWQSLWEMIERQARASSVSQVFVTAPKKFHELRVTAPSSSKLSINILDSVALATYNLSKDNYMASLVEQDIAIRAKTFLFSQSTRFCLPTHNCTSEQNSVWRPDSRTLFTECCKNGVDDGLIYGESFGGNIAEERWALGERSLNIPQLMGAQWATGWGARNCMLEGEDSSVGASEVHLRSLEASL